MKKLLVSALILAMVLGLGSTAFAAAGDIGGPAFTDIAGNEAEGDLTVLAALNVFTGDKGIGGTVRPDAAITRAEFSKVVVTAMGKGSTATGLMSSKPTYKDAIPTWAWGYVNAATYMQVISGYGDGTFGAGNNVTYGEAVTMLIRAVSGHNAQVPPGVWPYNFLFYGVDAEFSGGVDIGFANLPATRGDIARMVVATMQVWKLTKDGVKTATDTSVLGPKTTTGVFQSYTPGDNASVTIGGFPVSLGGPVYIVGASSYAGLLGLNVSAIRDKVDGKAVVLWVQEAANNVKGVFAGYSNEDSVAGNETYKLADGTKIPMAFSSATPPVVSTLVTVNGGTAGPENTTTTLIIGDEVVFTLGADGKATNVTALRFDLGKSFILSKPTKSNPVTKANTQIALHVGGSMEVPKSAAVTMNGGSADRDTLAQYDVLFVASTLGNTAYDATTNPVFAIRGARQSIEGTVKSYRTVSAGGAPTHYSTFEFADKSTKEYTVAVAELGGNIGVALTAGTGKFGLDAKGRVFVQQAYAAATTTVLVKSYTTGTAGSFVTVDARGAEVTYVADAAFPLASVGKVGVITIDGLTNKATNFVAYLPAGLNYDIVAVDVANGNLTLKQGAGYLFISGAVIYKFDTSLDTYTYVPFDQVSLWTSDIAAPIDHFINVSGTGPLVVYTVP